MKKNYVKPQIIIEDFSLSTTIAGSCDFIVDNASKYICAFYDEREEKNVFTSEISACTTTTEDGANGYCYHVPIETNDLFNS